MTFGVHRIIPSQKGRMCERSVLDCPSRRRAVVTGHRSEGYGLASVELNARNSTNHFSVGIRGKAIHGHGRDDAGRGRQIGLDDALTHYFPQGPAWWQRVTVRELLSHTAGLSQAS
jgi:Beta-lactamase